MSAIPELAEARATAEVLRATAKAVRADRGALCLRLYRAADVLDGMVALTLRCLERIEQFEQEVRELLGGDQ